MNISAGKMKSVPPEDVRSPAPLKWAADCARDRGAIIPLGARGGNAIGVHAGAFSAFRALSAATGALAPGHRPDLTGTEPVVRIGPFAQWSEPELIVTLDPFGHTVASDFAEERKAGYDVRPTIAVSSGHLRMGEVVEALKAGRLAADGLVLTSEGDILVTKIAIEPVWWLPGLARRLGLSEVALRRGLVEHTGGMYPALTARPDIDLFMPPIGGTSVYLFGDPARLSSGAPVTCRLHDECNGSDVFGSDLCTCRPYLGFAAEECVRAAQNGGIGVLVYNRKEGRALGEVVKYLVYNARPRGARGDQPADYFARTRQVAGVEDMRFQSLAVDPLHWLGIRRIDRWISMSNMKSEALAAAGIEIVQSVAIPDALVPRHAHVEIEAKKLSGYFS